MPNLNDFRVRYSARIGGIDLRAPLDDSRYRDTIVSRELSSGITIYEYEDGTFYSIEIVRPNAGLVLEAWGNPKSEGS